MKTLKSLIATGILAGSLAFSGKNYGHETLTTGNDTLNFSSKYVERYDVYNKKGQKIEEKFLRGGWLNGGTCGKSDDYHNAQGQLIEENIQRDKEKFDKEAIELIYQYDSKEEQLVEKKVEKNLLCYGKIDDIVIINYEYNNKEQLIKEKVQIDLFCNREIDNTDITNYKYNNKEQLIEKKVQYQRDFNGDGKIDKNINDFKIVDYKYNNKEQLIERKVLYQSDFNGDGKIDKFEKSRRDFSIYKYNNKDCSMSIFHYDERWRLIGQIDKSFHDDEGNPACNFVEFKKLK